MHTIHVEPGSELDRLVAEADDAPVELERNGVRYQLRRVERPADEDPWANYDPEVARAGIRAAAGAWKGLVDTEDLKAAIYRARDEGTRPLDRP